MVTRSLDPTGRGRARWAIRWKPALNGRVTPQVVRAIPAAFARQNRGIKGLAQR